MPVYRHLDSGKRFFFVHIPRTGGRFFERNLYDQHFGAEHDNIWNSIEDIEIAHAHRELYERHEEFGNLKNIPQLYKRKDIRMTLDYEDDFEFFKNVIEHFQGKTFGLLEIIQYINDNPEVKSINNHLEMAWKENQKRKN